MRTEWQVKDHETGEVIVKIRSSEGLVTLEVGEPTTLTPDEVVDLVKDLGEARESAIHNQ